MRTTLPLRQLACALALAAATVGLAAVVVLPWLVELLMVVVVYGLGLFVLRIITIADFRRILAQRAL
jgi:hypothetical protein